MNAREPEERVAGDPGRLLDGETLGVLGPGEPEHDVDDERHQAEEGREGEDLGDAEDLPQGADEEGHEQGAEAEEDAEDVQGRAALLAFVEIARQGVGPAVEGRRRRGRGRPPRRGRGRRSRPARGARKAAATSSGRNGQDGLEAEAVDDGPEEPAS